MEVIDSFMGPVPIRTCSPAASAPPTGGAVLLFHGLRSSMGSLAREAEMLSRAGLTVVLVDAPHHGARHSQVLATMPNALEMPGYATVLELVREARDEAPLLVDHLLREGHRAVAVGGVSFGAFIALAAATIEPRLAAIVSVLGTPDWTPRDGVVPDELIDVVAESPLARYATFTPRPLLLLNGALDDNVRPTGARALAAKLRPLYDASGAGPLVHHEYPCTHFPSEDVWHDMWSRAARFLVEGIAGRGKVGA
jgi:dienelactone hydrolase